MNNFGPNYEGQKEKLEDLRRYQMVAMIIGVILASVLCFVNIWASVACTVVAVLVSYHLAKKITKETQNIQEVFNKWNSSYQPEPHEYTQNNLNQATQLPPVEFGQMIQTTEADSFDRIILSAEVKSSVDNGINKFLFKDFLNENWNFKSIESLTGRNILNFFGPPGTGKTITAKALAHKINKPLFLVNYAQLEERWVGQTEKNISKIFKIAKSHNAILFLDEADTLVSKRIEEVTSQAKHINAARNVFMQELDKFDGMVILTTNLFSMFDEALLRRVCQNVKFNLPSEDMRELIIKAHIPSVVPLEKDVDFKELAKQSKGFSGGDIKNLVKESMIVALSDFQSRGIDLNKASLSQKHLMMELNKIKASKQSYTKEDEKKEIGISLVRN